MLKKSGLIMLVVIVIMLAGCSTNAVATTSSTTTSNSPVITTTTAPVNLTTSPIITTTPATTTTENIKIRIGSLPRIYDIIAYVAQQEGIYTHNNITVEVVPFRSETEKDTAMLAGNLDGVIEGTYGAINLNKTEETSKLVGHSFMPHMFDLIVSSSSGITEPSQLKGKKIATSTGTIMEYALDNLLTSNGVSPQDVTYVNVPSMPLRLEMLSQGSIEAALFTSPLSDQAVANGNKLLLDDTKELLGGPGLIFSTKALQEKSEGIARFIQSWQEAVNVINANPEKFRNIIVDKISVPEAIANTFKIPVFPELRLPTQEEFTKINNYMQAKGMITQPVAYDQCIETKFLN